MQQPVPGGRIELRTDHIRLIEEELEAAFYTTSLVPMLERVAKGFCDARHEELVVQLGHRTITVEVGGEREVCDFRIVRLVPSAFVLMRIVDDEERYYVVQELAFSGFIWVVSKYVLILPVEPPEHWGSDEQSMREREGRIYEFFGWVIRSEIP